MEHFRDDMPCTLEVDPRRKEWDHKERAHSKLGASGAERWTNCPGSVALCEQMPPAPSSVYAEEGTAAHELSEIVFRETPNAFYYVGRRKFNGFDVTKEMAEHVQSYVDYVRNIRNKLGGELLIEHRFHLKHLHPLFYGTCDAVVMQPFGELHVFDFKFGAGIAVEVEENEQMQFYALGALELGDFTKVVLHVCQPRAFHADGPWRTWETTPDKLIDFGKFLKSKAIETQSPNAPLQSGAWCRWCAAAPSCPQLRTKAIETARADFMAAEAPKLPAVEKLTDAQLAKVIEHKKALVSWFEAVEEHVELRLMNGEKIEGVKLVNGKNSRHWIDEESASEVLIGQLGENAYQRKLLTVAQAEKQIGKDSLMGLFQVVVGRPTVAVASDKRPAITAADNPDKGFGFTTLGDSTKEVSPQKTSGNRTKTKIEKVSIDDF